MEALHLYSIVIAIAIFLCYPVSLFILLFLPFVFLSFSLCQSNLRNKGKTLGILIPLPVSFIKNGKLEARTLLLRFSKNSLGSVLFLSFSLGLVFFPFYQKSFCFIVI